MSSSIIMASLCARIRHQYASRAASRRDNTKAKMRYCSTIIIGSGANRRRLAALSTSMSYHRAEDLMRMLTLLASGDYIWRALRRRVIAAALLVAVMFCRAEKTNKYACDHRVFIALVSTRLSHLFTHWPNCSPPTAVESEDAGGPSARSTCAL